MELISMTDFILSGKWDSPAYDAYSKENVDKITNYANFLKKPLELGMFVPTDEDGNVLKEPKKYYDNTSQSHAGAITDDWIKWYDEYQQAKERVLFEGFEIKIFSDLDSSVYVNTYIFINGSVLFSKQGDEFRLDNSFKTIEDLIPYNLTLTPTALKQINI